MNPLFLISIVIVFCQSGYAQDGPGGVGNAGNNVLWLRPDEITNLVDDDDIFTWTDLSGNNNDVTQPSQTLTPIYKTNIQNGQPVVRFNKANGRIRRTGFTSFPTTQITEYYVNRNNGETNDGVLSYASSGSLHNDFLLYSSNNLQIYRSVPIANTGQVLNDNVFHVLGASWRSSDGSVDIWKDGVNSYAATGAGLGTSITAGGSFAIAGEQDVVDGNYSANQAHFGDFGDVIVYNTYLNDAQQIIVSNYLSAKYNIPLLTNDYYNEDDAVGGNYDFEVAGIGRLNVANMHDHSKGSGIVEILNPTGLDDNEFLLWGHNNGIQQAVEYVDIPVGVEARFDRVWRASEVNTSNLAIDVGAIDIRFDLSTFNPVTNTDLRLLIDTDNDGVFADETPIPGAVNLGGEVYEFSGVTGISDNLRFTLSTINIAQTPLPVELISFQANRIGEGKVFIHWQTATELNSDFFTVEHSQDGINWSVVGVVSAKGNAIDVSEYFLVDYNPYSGTTYYRLKQTDFDGDFEYSQIVSVQLNMDELLIYPNPTDHHFTLMGPTIEIENVGIIDMFGKNVSELINVNVVSSEERLFDISNLSAGLYFIRTKTQVVQFVKK